MDFLIYTALAILFVIILELRWRQGNKSGINTGNANAQRILLRGMEVRISPTAHNALICMAGNQTMDEMVEALEALGDKNSESQLKKTTCYLVVHQELVDGVLVTKRVGHYSESAQSLTRMGNELNSCVIECDGKGYAEAKGEVLKWLDYMADLGVEPWVHLRKLLGGRA